MSEIILTSEQIEHKLERIAYQILEANGENQTIIIAGIVSNGYAVAKRIVHHLKVNSSKEILSCEIKIDKKKSAQSHSDHTCCKRLYRQVSCASR